MDKEKYIYTQSILLIHKNEWNLANLVICSDMNETGGHHVKRNMLDTEKEVPPIPLICGS